MRFVNTPKDLLALPSRKKIYDFVAANPGEFRNEIERRLGMGNGTMTHHLDCPVRGGLVLFHKDKNKLRYYVVAHKHLMPPGAFSGGTLKEPRLI